MSRRTGTLSCSRRRCRGTAHALLQLLRVQQPAGETGEGCCVSAWCTAYMQPAGKCAPLDLRELARLLDLAHVFKRAARAALRRSARESASRERCGQRRQRCARRQRSGKHTTRTTRQRWHGSALACRHQIQRARRRPTKNQRQLHCLRQLAGMPTGLELVGRHIRKVFEGIAGEFEGVIESYDKASGCVHAPRCLRGQLTRASRKLLPRLL